MRVVRRPASEARPECVPRGLALLGLLDRLLLVVVRLLAPVLLAVVRRDPRVLRLLVVLPLRVEGGWGVRIIAQSCGVIAE